MHASIIGQGQRSVAFRVAATVAATLLGLLAVVAIVRPEMVMTHMMMPISRLVVAFGL